MMGVKNSFIRQLVAIGSGPGKRTSRDAFFVNVIYRLNDVNHPIALVINANVFS